VQDIGSRSFLKNSCCKFLKFGYYSTETLMNSNLQNAGVIVTVAACSAAERGTVAADAAAVGDMVSSGGFGE
jgi:hypothetical protein